MVHYVENEFGDELYPKKKNGSEYYLYDKRSKEPRFAVDRAGVSRYARDALGNEIYPKRGPFFVRHIQWDYPIYARDKIGNETYPVDPKSKHEVFAKLSDGEMLIARYSCGRQRYPMDRRGNEYFPLCKVTGKPYYLRDDNGRVIPPLTYNNCFMYLSPEEAITESILYQMKDALGTTVFTEDHIMKTRSAWMQVKESLMAGCCCLFAALNFCL